VVNIWASWCPGCNDEAADLRAFAAAHTEAQLLGVDTQDTKDSARAFYRRWRWAHPSVFDPHGELAAKLGLQGLPTTIFLDRRHRIVARVVGATDRAGFEAGLRKALE
jgi:cytochrome c biogenesis protein CcmG/thiol:disulfide interchange protein DsbE